MKILIGDDHSVVRRGLKMIILEEFPNAFIQEAIDGADVLKMLDDQPWDIIISDISMPGRSGVEIIKLIKELAPKIPILILSVHAAEHYAVRTLKVGASGYLTKESAPEELVKAIKQIVSGRRYITPDIADLLVDQQGGLEDDHSLHKQLSNREFEVMKMIAEGKKVSDIGDKLSLSINTISTYRARILEKMNMASNAELTKYAMTNGLI
ncbi:MAG: response regulator transcription factor [Pedobacter sp.]|nr:response regulator transcription factor [Chitinophagaceae bacterium]